MFETTNELILVISTCIAGVCSIIAAIRLSKCEYVRVCGGLFLIKRNLINNSKASITNTSKTDLRDEVNNITKIIQGIPNSVIKSDGNTSKDIENPLNISPSGSTLSLDSAISV